MEFMRYRLLWMCVTVLSTLHPMWVVVSRTFWTRLTTAVSASLPVSYHTLESSAVSTCGVCQRVSQLSTSKDELMCHVTVLCVRHAVPPGSCSRNLCALYRQCITCYTLLLLLQFHMAAGDLEFSLIIFHVYWKITVKILNTDDLNIGLETQHDLGYFLCVLSCFIIMLRFSIAQNCVQIMADRWDLH